MERRSCYAGQISDHSGHTMEPERSVPTASERVTLSASPPQESATVEEAACERPGGKNSDVSKFTASSEDSGGPEEGMDASLDEVPCPGPSPPSWLLPHIGVPHWGTGLREVAKTTARHEVDNMALFWSSTHSMDHFCLLQLQDVQYSIFETLRLGCHNVLM